jgi:hypothetical protein
MSQELGWQALGRAHSIVDRCNELDEATLEIVAKSRTQEAGAATKSESEAMDGELRCVLCDAPAGEGSKSFSLTPEARERFRIAYPDADPEAVLVRNVICARCQTLSQQERQKLVQRAIERELKCYRDFIRNQV